MDGMDCPKKNRSADLSCNEASRAAKENTVVDLHIVCKDSFFFVNCHCNSAKSPREPREPFYSVKLLPASRGDLSTG